MKIRILVVGKLKEDYWRAAIQEYQKRLKPYAEIEIEEVNDLPCPEKSSSKEEELIKEKEGEFLLHKWNGQGWPIALDIKGKNYDSLQFSDFLVKSLERGRSSVAFFIGGSLGLGNNVLNAARERVSFSPLTFPHQLCRVILLEQLYRSFRILNHEPYHK